MDPGGYFLDFCELSLIFAAVKKIFLLCWLLVYALGALGFTLHQHVCMGKPAGISWVDSKEKACPRCGMAEKDKAGCCHDAATSYQVKDDHSPSFLAFALKAPQAELPVFFAAPMGAADTPSLPMGLAQRVVPPGKVLQRLAQLMVFRI